MRSVAYDQQCSQRGGSARSAKLAYGHTRLPAVAGPAHSRRPSWSFGTVTPFKGVTQQLSINVLRPKVPAAGLIRATADFQRAADTSLQQQEAQLGALLQRTQKVISWHDKVALLQSDPAVQSFFSNYRQEVPLIQELMSLSAQEVYTILCLPAMGQEHVLTAPVAEGTSFRVAVQQLAATLKRVEVFYDSIGGLLGYQHKSLQIMVERQQHTGDPCSGNAPAAEVSFHMPRGPDLAGPDGRQLAAQSAAAGLDALPHMAEIYPLGGAGDRLGLKCEVTGEGLPVAVLPYCGRPLLQSLIRDVQAREFLYYKLHGVQQMTPIAIMTSDAKDNHRRVTDFIAACDWFGRGKESFRLFRQPLVPLISAEDGKWLVPEGLAPLLKPGGHGAIWKLMQDEGVFEWLYQHDRQAAIVRQISNPMAGTDATLLALSGAGYADSRSFGFASCPRVVGAAEGMNVLLERRLQKPDGQVEHAYNVTNVEYTEFEKQGICDVPASPGSQYSCFPANTNVLYVGLKAAQLAVKAGVEAGGGAALPGMILNTSKKTTFVDGMSGKERSVASGRMECTMQNLVDSLAQHFQEAVPEERHEQLNTFVVYNQRSRVTSSAKRKRQPGSLKIHQTPDGSFLDLMRNGRDVLLRCGFQVPQLPEVQDYLEAGPSFIFLFHPSLGPLWDVIAQKICGGSLAAKSEMVLEVAEASLCNVHVQGSLQVQADCVMGQTEQALAVNYSQIRSHRDLQLHQLRMRADRQRDNGSALGQTRLPLHEEFSNIIGSAPGGRHSRMQAAPASPSKVDGHRLVYSNRCGRICLNNVTVQNEGVDWINDQNVFWQHKVQRHESCEVVLHGRSEFEATDVVIKGSQRFEVPDGYKMTVTAGAAGFQTKVQALTADPSWEWKYSMADEGNIEVAMQEHPSMQQHRQVMHDAAALSYII